MRKESLVVVRDTIDGNFLELSVSEKKTPKAKRNFYFPILDTVTESSFDNFDSRNENNKC